MKYRVHGNGYNCVARVVTTRDGYALRDTKSADFVTCGIGYPMAYPAVTALLDAIRQHRPNITIELESV